VPRFEESSHRIEVPSHGEVSLRLARPAEFESLALLAHGAGGNLNTPFLATLQRKLAERAIAAARFNFLYSEARRRAPDRTALLEACWRSVADWARQVLPSTRLFLGGKSMGGRIASHLAAAGYPCAGVFFLGYPLHPPRQESRLRKDHLPQIKVPLLFISGTRDPLCRLELLRPILAGLGERARLHLIEGGDHSFKTPRGTGTNESEVMEEILTVLVEWMRAVGPQGESAGS
jgi:hypothetical protein